LGWGFLRSKNPQELAAAGIHAGASMRMFAFRSCCASRGSSNNWKQPASLPAGWAVPSNGKIVRIDLHSVQIINEYLSQDHL
jgi:hypothetical protein